MGWGGLRVPVTQGHVSLGEKSKLVPPRGQTKLIQSSLSGKFGVKLLQLCTARPGRGKKLHGVNAL